MSDRPMTRIRALAEARRRWEHGNYIARVSKDMFGYCMVGRQERGERIIEATGCGETWEIAFADADQRERHAAHLRRSEPKGGTP